MGNNSVYQIVGVGNIRMMLHDGHERTLSNVRHVPDLKKNLLLLRAFEAQECRFIGESGSVTVTKGAITVLKGERMSNLYKMVDNIIVGDILAATVKKGDTTRLWHMHLGHIKSESASTPWEGHSNRY